MLDFYEKRKFRNWLYSKPVLILVGVVVPLLLFSVWGVYQKERETAGREAQRASVLTELEEREKVLSEEIGRLNTERGLEEEIRSKFEVAREGEEVIVIVDSQEEESTERRVEDMGIFTRFLNLFR